MKTTKIYKKLFGSLLIVAASLPFMSNADTTQPAQFGDAINQLSSKVTLPDVFQGGFKTVAVYCQTDVAATGLTGGTLCYEQSDVADLKQQTLNALEGVSFIPAEVNGQAVPVRVQFRVVYSRTGDQPDIMLLPNLGTLQSQYGHDYFAPQERLDQKDWYSKYAANSWAKGKPFFNAGDLTRVIGTVKVDGEIASVSALDARGRSKRDAGVIETALKQTKFIPGVVDNKITEMHYVAVLNYRN